jgi:hypothetical protein
VQDSDAERVHADRTVRRAQCDAVIRIASPRRNAVSVIVGISANSDFMLQNAGYRILMEIAFGRTDRADDRRALEAGGWAHFLDLTSLDRDQARRIAWLLDAAAQSRIDEWLADGTQQSLGAATYYESLQEMLRHTFGAPDPELSWSTPAASPAAPTP